MAKKKNKNVFDYILEYMEMAIYGFFLFFFLIYIGKYGISDLILKRGSKHEIIFNIGVWFVLTGFCINGLFKEISQRKGDRKK